MRSRRVLQTMPDGVLGWSKWVLQVWFITFVAMPVFLAALKIHEFREAVSDSFEEGSE